MRLIQSKKTLLVLVLIAIVYSTLAFVILPAESFFAGDEGVKFIQMQSLLKSNYKNLSLYYPGKNIDRENRFFPITSPYAIEKEGKVFSQWSVIFPLLTSLPFKIFKYQGLYIIPVFSSFFTLLIVSRFVRFLTGKESFIAPLLLAFATPLFFYSFTFWEHTLSVFLATLSIYLFVLSLEDLRAWRMVTSGVLLAFGIWARNELYFLVFALLIASIAVNLSKNRTVRFKGYSCFFAGLVLILVPMWLTQWVTLREFLGADVSQFVKSSVVTEVTPFKGNLILFLAYKAKLAVVLLLHRFKSEWMALLGLSYILFVLLLAFPKLKGKNISLYLSLAGIIFTSLFAFSQNLLNSGILTNAPLLVLSLLILPIYKNIEKGKASFLIFLTGAIYIFLVAVFAPATGGMQWGPRFMLPALPLLLIVIENVWCHRKELMAQIGEGKSIQLFASFLVLISIVVQLIGVLVLYQDKARDKKLLDEIRNRPEDIFVTDSFWFPQEMAALYDTKKFFFVENTDDFESLAEKLYKNKENSFAYVTTGRDAEFTMSRIHLNFRESEKQKLPSGFLLKSFSLQ